MSKLEIALDHLAGSARLLEEAIHDTYQEWKQDGPPGLFHDYLTKKLTIALASKPRSLLTVILADAALKELRPKRKKQKPEPVRSLPFAGRSGGAA